MEGMVKVCIDHRWQVVSSRTEWEYPRWRDSRLSMMLKGEYGTKRIYDTVVCADCGTSEERLRA